MHHGGAAIEPVHLAADQHFLVDGQGLFQPIAFHLEKGQRQFACLVVKEYAIGHVGFAWRWRLMPVYTALNSYDDPLRCQRDAGSIATIDER